MYLAGFPKLSLAEGTQLFCLGDLPVSSHLATRSCVYAHCVHMSVHTCMPVHAHSQIPSQLFPGGHNVALSSAYQNPSCFHSSDLVGPFSLGPSL